MVTRRETRQTESSSSFHSSSGSRSPATSTSVPSLHLHDEARQSQEDDLDGPSAARDDDDDAAPASPRIVALRLSEWYKQEAFRTLERNRHRSIEDRTRSDSNSMRTSSQGDGGAAARRLEDSSERSLSPLDEPELKSDGMVRTLRLRQRTTRTSTPVFDLRAGSSVSPNDVNGGASMRGEASNGSAAARRRSGRVQASRSASSVPLDHPRRTGAIGNGRTTTTRQRRERLRADSESAFDEHSLDESEDLDAEDDDADDLALESKTAKARRRVEERRKIDRGFVVHDENEDDEEDEDGNPIRRSGRPRRQTRFFAQVDAPDSGEEYQGTSAGKQGRLRRKKEEEEARREREARLERQRKLDEQASRAARAARRQRLLTGEFADDPGDPQADEDEDEDHEQPRQYTLRERREVNYKLPEPVPVESKESKEKRRAARERAKRRPRPGIGLDFAGLQSSNGPWNPMGALFDARRDMLAPGEDSDDNEGANAFASASRQVNRGSIASGPAGAGSMLAGNSGNLLDLGASLGKVDGIAQLADTDPLGVAQDITFESVGGLDEYINQLKEMVSLPLLYPEVFQKFAITPPRGVLFHGPPGTGKTLVARALAASCSKQGQKISFFMRKGADCLSKWVGEAERQLRLLFEEARRCQPSIIFFDEIDGLAPVRSSKQDQIHASIVSTLLALMDGMDGRGQVVVIGATNRPDAIDPALRRPGRFDREFYFPLPNLTARKKIIEIHTAKWQPPLAPSFIENLAELTKGYGGADLRALCTEAAINAVQRSYPQIYKSTERLLIKPETINVAARDFMRSVKKLVPSSERSTSAVSKPLPEQLVPLLHPTVERCIAIVEQLFPRTKDLTSLEEAEYEEDAGSFEQEMKTQSWQALRVNRPRMIIHGSAGMGQGHVGAAVLHHLERTHVQSFDLANLLSDSTRSAEAACVQLFSEVKRHKPSVIFIPSLATWANANAVSDTLRTTFKQLLDSIAPTDPVLLLAVLEDDFDSLPRDVRSWFGFDLQARVAMLSPSISSRTIYFSQLADLVQKPPTEFPGALARTKRVLEDLPKAGPLPIRQPSKVELQAQRDHDDRLKELLKWRLGPIMNELKRKYKRFLRSSVDDAHLAYMEDLQKISQIHTAVETGQDNEEIQELQRKQLPRLYDIDLETMHERLYYGAYLTPLNFARDVGFILHDAEMEHEHDYDMSASGLEKVHKAREMLNHTNVMLAEAFEPAFIAECDKMADREGQRAAAKKAAEQPPNGAAVKGTRRTNGVQPEYGLLPNVDKILRKRVRTSSQASSSHSGEHEKKQRTDVEVIEVESQDQNAPLEEVLPPLSTDVVMTEHDAMDGDDLERSPPVSAAAAEEPTPNAAAPDVNIVERDGIERDGIQAMTPEPAALARFELDQNRLDDMLLRYVECTESWNVEALEALRAVSFDHIWRHRSHWDRNPVVAGLEPILNRLIEEVNAQAGL